MRSEHVGQRLHSLDQDEVANRQNRLPQVSGSQGAQHSQIPRATLSQSKLNSKHVSAKGTGDENNRRNALGSPKSKLKVRRRTGNSISERRMMLEHAIEAKAGGNLVTGAVISVSNPPDEATTAETRVDYVVDREVVTEFDEPAETVHAKSNVDLSKAGDSPTNTEQLVNVEHGKKDVDLTEKKNSSEKTSPLDKDLPPKPSLRSKHSPERRGVFDATDSAIKLLNDSHPALAPNRSERHLAPPRPINERRSASVANVSHNGSPLARKSQSTPQIMDGYPPRSSFPPTKQALGDNSPRASFPQSKQTSEGYSPRSRVGVGPRVRIANDADEIIMGAKFGKARVQQLTSNTPGDHRSSRIPTLGSVHPPRISSLPNSPEVAEAGNAGPSPSIIDRLSRPTKSSARRAADSKTSILERGKKSSKIEYGAVIPSTKDRSTSATLRKTSRSIRSAMHALIPGRRRTENGQKTAAAHSSPVEGSPEVEKSQDTGNLIVHHPTHPSARGVTFAELPEKPTRQGNAPRSLPVRVPRNSSVQNKNGAAPSSAAGAHDWKSKPNDKMAPDNNHQARTDAESFMNQVHRETNAARALLNNNQPLTANRRGGEDDDPNTPPRSREGLAGHYAEENGLVRDRFNESLPGVTAFLDEGLRGAEDGLFRIVELIDQVQDADVRATMLIVVGALETSIAATREARMANIVLHENVAALINLTAQIAARAVEESTVAIIR